MLPKKLQQTNNCSSKMFSHCKVPDELALQLRAGPISGFFEDCIQNNESPGRRARAEGEQKPLRERTNEGLRTRSSSSPASVGCSGCGGLQISEEQVRAFLVRHNAARVCMVHRIMLQYSNNQEELRRKFLEKYGEDVVTGKDLSHINAAQRMDALLQNEGSEFKKVLKGNDDCSTARRWDSRA